MRDLAIAQPFRSKLETTPVADRQRVRNHQQTGPQLLAPVAILGARRRVDGSSPLEEEPDPTSAHLARPVPQGQVVGHAKDPASEIRARPATREVTEQGQEDLLDDVLTVFVRDTDRTHVPKHPIPVRIEQLQHRLLHFVRRRHDRRFRAKREVERGLLNSGLHPSRGGVYYGRVTGHEAGGTFTAGRPAGTR